MQVIPAEVVLDASVWVSRELRADPNHLDATTWVNQHLQAGGHFVEPVWFLTEVAAAISRRVSSNYASNTIALLSYLRRNQVMRFLPMSAALMRDTIDLATTHGIRAGDVVYVALARQLTVPLVSFDKDHLTRASGIVTVIRP